MTSTNDQIERWFQQFPPVAQRLQTALAAVMSETIDGNCRAMDIERTFDLNRTFASRLNRALSAATPRQMAVLLPGRPTMMRLMERAAELCSSEAAVRELREAYFAYLREVGRIASNQQELAAVLNANDPQSRREAAVGQRAAFFRAASDLVGGNIEVASSACMIWPNANDPRFGDKAFVQTYCGLRRLGVMDLVIIASGASDSVSLPSREPSRRLDGGAFSDHEHGAIVTALSSDDLPAMRTVSTGNVVYTTCRGETLPQGASFDVVSAVRHDRWVRNIRSGEFGSEEFISKPNTPSKLRINDYLIHRDMWPGIEPVVREYRDSDLPVSVNNAGSEPLLSPIANYDDFTSMSANDLVYPLSDAPKHADLVRYMFDHVDVDLDDFRAYRHITRYPAIGHSLWVIFRREA